MSRRASSSARVVAVLATFFCLDHSHLPAVEPTSAGLHDLVVYDPGAHERGLPAARIRDGRVEIPPTVHIHRYYYSGDKEYQGPIINGGPTVVVAHHPKTGEKMYIDAVLPAGAPRIAYDGNSITYVYRDKRVELKFQHWPFDPQAVVVKHHSGRGWGRNVHEAHEHVSSHVKETMDNSSLVHSLKEASGEVGDIASGIKTTAQQFASSGITLTKNLVNVIPGVAYLKSLKEQQPQRDYESQIREAARQKEQDLPQFLRTNQ